MFMIIYFTDLLLVYFNRRTAMFFFFFFFFFFYIENIIDSGLEGLNKTSVLVAHKYIDIG